MLLFNSWESFLELISGELAASKSGVDTLVLTLGFISAFVSALFACKVRLIC
jgi:undecaprenyl pyrophosphate phosphatase UppP